MIFNQLYILVYVSTPSTNEDSFWATVSKTVRPMLSDRCLSVLSVCLSRLSCLSVTLVYCGQTVGWIKMKLGLQISLGSDHGVLDGDPAPPPQRGTAPQFSAHICCGQMAGWINMPLGMEVGLGPGDFVLDGDPAPPPHFSAHFWATVCKTVRPMLSVCCLSCLSVCISVCDVRAPWPNGCTDHAARPWPWPHCVT